jgi:hypothetical protein
MSVTSARLAAAQRTAAGNRGGSSRHRRWLRLASWLFIVPMLSLFSFSVVAGAMTVGKLDYAAAIRQLPADKPVVILKSGGKPLACSVSQGQATGLAARWSTGWLMMAIEGSARRTLWVKGPNEHELRSFLGGSAADCKLIREKTIFYLPFNANLS